MCNTSYFTFLFMSLVSQVVGQSNAFLAERVQRSATFVLNAPIEKAFPLFGPIREKDWAAGWEPEILYSNHDEVEQHMIFRTSSSHRDADHYLWVVSQYRPEIFFIEYTVSTPQRIWFITVSCRPSDDKTTVTVTYTYTGLSDEGNRTNKMALEKMYVRNLKDWEEALNFYLATGKRME
jgi:hypothetical protein